MLFTYSYCCLKCGEIISANNIEYKTLYSTIFNNINEYMVMYKNKINTNIVDTTLYMKKGDRPDLQCSLEINKNYTLYIDKINFNHFDSLFEFYYYSFDWSVENLTPVQAKDSLYNQLTYRKTFCKDTIIKTYTSNSGCIYFTGIIGLFNGFDYYPYFISGNYKLDDIKDIVFKDTLFVELVEDYVKLRYYSYFPKNIIVTEEKAGQVYSVIFESDIYKYFVVISRLNEYEEYKLKKKYSEKFVQIY